MKTYQVVNGTSYGVKTNDKVIVILENARKTNQKLHFKFGDIETGKVWPEENDTIGTIGRSNGSIKIPLLIVKKSDMGGGGLLDDCILQIKIAGTDTVLFQADNYQTPKLKIVESDMKEYQYNTMYNGELFGRHKTINSAAKTVKILQ